MIQMKYTLIIMQKAIREEKYLDTTVRNTTKQFNDNGIVPLDQVTEIQLCSNNIINPQFVHPLYSPADPNPSISLTNKCNIKW